MGNRMEKTRQKGPKYKKAWLVWYKRGDDPYKALFVCDQEGRARNLIRESILKYVYENALFKVRVSDDCRETIVYNKEDDSVYLAYKITRVFKR